MEVVTNRKARGLPLQASMRWFGLGTTLLSVSLAAGCGSAATTAVGEGAAAESAATPSGSLRGVYVTTSPGPMTKLSFIDDTRALVTWRACSKGTSCTRAVTYVLNADETSLELTDAANGQKTTLAFKAVAEDPTGSSTQATHPLDDPQQVVAPPQPSLVQRAIQLLKSFVTSDAGQSQQFTEDPDDPTAPAANQANTPDSPYDCAQGVCMFDDSSFWQNQ
jgi:hypothetical protein